MYESVNASQPITVSRGCSGPPGPLLPSQIMSAWSSLHGCTGAFNCDTMYSPLRWPQESHREVQALYHLL